ncbi:hypothetical protein AC1031_003755 [Aphanomyces cochlioides]|nr:hypothetical protein AC1031_003755 [Aphanomyces cochlioides]
MKAIAWVLLLLGFACVNFVSADCNTCVYSGECSTAYRGAPGQSCGVVAGRTCCCPVAAYCASSSNQCLCKAGQGPVRPSGGGSSSGTIFGSILSFLFLVCLAWILCRCCCTDREPDYVAVPQTQYVPVAQPAQYAQPGYAYQQQPVYVSGPPQPVVYQTYQPGYGSVAGAAVGAAVGVAAGVAIGESLSHDHDGGYDGGYTFSGDTGGNTFAGDSGDNGGGDFAGDF